MLCHCQRKRRSLSSGIFNILETLVKGETLQMLHTSGFSGFRGVEKALQEVQPHDADEGHATHDGSHQPRQSEGSRGGRDPHRQMGSQGPGTVTRFQRVAQSHLDLHAAPRHSACADPAGRQDRGLQEHQRQSRDHRGGKARTQEP